MKGHDSHLKTDIEVIRVQLSALEKTVGEGRDETRRWREELKQEGLTMFNGFLTRMDKHEVEDEAHHQESLRRIDRLENQTLEAGKDALRRVENLEKATASAQAVDTYKRWLIGLALTLAGSLGYNLLRFFEFIHVGR